MSPKPGGPPRARPVLAALLLLAAAPYAVRAGDGKEPAREVRDLSPLLAKVVEEHGVPGMAAAVVRTVPNVAPAHLAGLGAAGVRARGSDAKVLAADRFHLGSCTKAMTATLCAILVEEGKLAWDTPVGQDTQVPPMRGDPAIGARFHLRRETARKVPHERRADAGRRWKVPKESPPGPDFGLSDFEAVAKEGARLWPDLAPLGGSRWTREDIAFAVSVLDAETRARAFRKASSRGMTSAQARLWLSKALHHRLLDQAKCSRRIKLLDCLVLDTLPATKGRRLRLEGDDAATLASRLHAILSADEERELVRRLGGDGIGSSSGPRAQTGPSRGTRARKWVTACGVLQRMAAAEGLNQAEAGLVVLALAAKLTGGGGAPKEDS